jgi:hypothetical protein
MEQSNKPKNDDLTQQRLKAFQPVYTLESTIGVLVTCALLFLVFGFVLYVQADKVVEKIVYYSKPCRYNSTCELDVMISGELTQPIYVYYELNNFYQNHRKYIKSRSYKQLMGNDLDKNRLGECEGVVEGADQFDNYRHYLNGSRIEDDAVLNPCGLMARSMFNDTFELYDPKQQRVDINETLIAWESDKEYLFKHVDGYENKTWVDIEDEHFIVWMRAATTKNFRKLWGRIDKVKSMPAGTYRLVVHNNYNVSSWKGKKRFVITNANALGGKNYFLGTIFIFTSLLCLFASMFFCGRAMISKKGSVTVEQLSW